MTCALRYARAAPALAMSYISVVLTILYGYFIFYEVRAWPIFSLCTLRHTLSNKLAICLHYRLARCEWGVLRTQDSQTFHIAPQGSWKHPMRQSMQ